MFHEIFNKIFITRMQLSVRQMVVLCPLEPTKKAVRKKNYGAVCQMLHIYESKSSLFRIRLFFFQTHHRPRSLALAIKVDPKSFSL